MEFHEKIDKIFRDAELMRELFKELEGVDPGPLYGLQTDGGDVFSVLAAGSPGNAYLIAGLSPPHQMPDPIDIYEQVRAIALEEAGGDEEKRARLHIAFIQEVGGQGSSACARELASCDKIFLLSADRDFQASTFGRNVIQKLKE